ncbi:MAG: efflux RND transporter periplasmic adaptor subunit [Alphaproteobacteria bacterium]|nr:efflux RND transporter periplasmic adaptor subunit [Alphaproteobacteria bacterium]
MKKIFSILITLTLLVTGCDDTNQSAKQTSLPTVDVLKIKAQNVPLSFSFTARAQGYKETEVRARVGGILLKRNYKEGSEVEEGSVLFEIDPEPYEIALKQAEAKLAQNQAELKNAQSQLNRTQTLFKKGYASEKTLDDAIAKADSLKATVQMSEANVDEAKLNLSYTTVKAPISGLTSLEAQSEGSLISTSGSSGLLTTITQINPIYVLFSVSENELMALTNMVDSGKVKNPNGVKDIYAKLELSDGSMYNEDGKINFITPNIDTSTGTVTLRAVFPNAQNSIRPGQFLRLILEGLVRVDALVIPQSAVMQDVNGSYVYCINTDNIIKKVLIKTGLNTPNGDWIIDSGLKAGDNVIISDLMKLRQGMSVIPNYIKVQH